jgi:hypothetical protein
VGFADYAGAVAGVANVAHMALSMPKVWVCKRPNAMLMNLISGHHAGASGHTHRRTGEALGEYGALVGKCIQMGRNRYWITRVAHGVCALLVAKNEYYVGSRHEWLGCLKPLSHNVFATSKILRSGSKINYPKIGAADRPAGFKPAVRN